MSIPRGGYRARPPKSSPAGSDTRRRYIIAGNHEQFKECVRRNQWKMDRCIYVSESRHLLGLRGEDVTFVFTGAHWRNPMAFSDQVRWLRQEGATDTIDATQRAQVTAPTAGLLPQFTPSDAEPGILAQVHDESRLYLFKGIEDAEGANDPCHRAALLLMGQPLRVPVWLPIEECVFEFGIRALLRPAEVFWTGSGWSPLIKEALKFKTEDEAASTAKLIYTADLRARVEDNRVQLGVARFVRHLGVLSHNAVG